MTDWFSDLNDRISKGLLVPDVAQPSREPGEEHPCLKQADELHELGFNAGWNGAVEECAKLVDGFDCHLAGYPNDEAQQYYESGVADACNMLEERVRALAAQPPAAPVETERKTFTIPPGHEAVRDSEGRATGEVRPRLSAATGDADEYEKRIREKLFNSGILTSGEWVYLVGLFQTAREHEDCGSGPQEVGMREALQECVDTLQLVEHPSNVDPQYGEEVRRLGERIGYGALMSSASASWRKKLAEDGYPVSGVFVAGPCHGSVLTVLKKARAALSLTRPKL